MIHTHLLDCGLIIAGCRLNNKKKKNYYWKRDWKHRARFDVPRYLSTYTLSHDDKKKTNQVSHITHNRTRHSQYKMPNMASPPYTIINNNIQNGHYRRRFTDGHTVNYYRYCYCYYEMVTGQTCVPKIFRYISDTT